MGILDATFDSIGGALADQWRDVITAGRFDEHTLVAPGIRKNSKNGRGNNQGTDDVITNGSVIYVPENTAAFVFSQSGIEQVITTPGGYTYNNGKATVFDALDQDARSVGLSILEQAAERVTFSGMPSESKRVAFVNLRELRGIRFGTHGPLAYNDLYYGADLEVFAYGMISVQVCNPELVIRNFVPANCSSYSLDDPRARRQLTGEFLTSFIASVNALSSEFRVSQLPSQTTSICDKIRDESDNAGTWPERYGLKLVSVAIENIEFSEQSRELVRQFSEKRMGVRAYEDVSQEAANISAQQMIAQGVRDNGLGEGGNMLFGMNLASELNPRNASAGSDNGMQPNAAETKEASFDSQVENIKKLKELLDAGILTQKEFDAKKHEILGL